MPDYEHIRLSYRDRDDYMTFEFVFINATDSIDDNWIVYIITDIDYGDYPADGHSTHRLYDNRDTYNYICWDETIASFEDAKAITAMWADVTSRYIRGYGAFDDIASELINS